MNRLAKILSSVRSNFLLLIICGVYLALSFAFINTPGLEYDEVLFGSGALGLNGDFVVFRWSVAGHQLPLMLMPYIGAIKAYIYRPLFMLFTPSALTVRLPVIIIGLTALLLTYLLTRNLFGRLTAVFGAALLATDPSYIFHIRNDWGPVALMMLFKVGSLYFLVRFAQTKQRAFLVAGAFMLGLGVYDKANFLWYLFALPLAAFLIWPRQCRILLSRRNLTTAAMFFVLGCWPLLLFNLAKKGATFREQIATSTPLSNAIAYKTQVLKETLNGTAAYHFINNGAEPGYFRSAGAAGFKGNSFSSVTLGLIDFQETLLPPALLVAAIVIVLLLMFSTNRGRRAISFVIILALVIFAGIIATPRATGSHHILMLYPFPQIIVAYAASGLWSWKFTARNPSTRLTAGVVLAALLFSLLVSNLVLDAKYLQSFRAIGGKGIWSAAVFQLAEFGQANRKNKLLLMDWGFENQLQLLSRGSLNREEFFWTLLDQKREKALVDLLYQKAGKDNDTIFVFHTSPYAQFTEPRRIFDRMLAKYALSSQTVKVFYQNDGEAVFQLEQISPDRP
jgi:4-amino-4-deoxy-L-arabinose transferase-like glycosyltransferase